MYCLSDGENGTLIENGFAQFCTNGKKGAYIANNALYTLELDVKKPKITLASENFGDYSLCGMSDNGKYIFCSDENGNLNRIPFKYKGSDWTRMAIDPKTVALSSDGRRIIYSSDGVLYYGKDDKPTKIADLVNTDKTFVTNNVKKAVCLAESDASKAENAYSLYVFDGKKATSIADNVTALFVTKCLSSNKYSPSVYTSPYVPELVEDEQFDPAVEGEDITASDEKIAEED